MLKWCIIGSGDVVSRLVQNSFYIKNKSKVIRIMSFDKNSMREYAKKYKIPFVYINTNLKNYENKILLYLRRYKVNFICLAGYMKIISHRVINLFDKKIINVHPSLLPKFKGLNTFERVLKNKENKTGCTIHFVNKKLDDGSVILKKSFFLKPNDNESSLKKKTQALEYRAYPEAIIKVFRNY